MKTQGLFGLVLAGGQSKRMGKDKSLLEFHGMPQKDYTYRLLSQFCEEVFTSIRADASPSEFKSPIPDKFSFGGPMNGILSALEHQNDVGWVTLPVDMPLVNDSTLRFLIKNRQPTKIATCFRHVDSGDLEPLLTIWEPLSRKSLLEFCHNGKNSPYDFLKSSDVHFVNFNDGNLLTSINTPDDFNAFQRDKGKS